MHLILLFIAFMFSHKENQPKSNPCKTCPKGFTCVNGKCVPNDEINQANDDGMEDQNEQMDDGMYDDGQDGYDDIVQ